MASCRACSQSIAAYASSVVASWMPRSGPSVMSPHQAIVDSFEPGCATREMISASARSRCRPAGPSSAGKPSLRAIAYAAATCPCGTDRATLTAASPGGNEDLALQRGLDRVHHAARHLRQVRERLVPDFPAVAVGAAQQPRLVFPLAALLVGVRALDPGHVHRRRLLHHERSLAAYSPGAQATRQDFPGYTLKPPEGSRA